MEIGSCAHENNIGILSVRIVITTRQRTSSSDRMETKKYCRFANHITPKGDQMGFCGKERKWEKPNTKLAQKKSF